MFYWLSKIIGLWIQPSNFLALLTILTVLLLFVGYPTLAKWTGGLLAILVAAIFVTPLPYMAMAELEGRFAKPDPMPEHVTGIIVLGGATHDFVSHARGEPNMSEHGERLIEGYLLSRRYPDAHLVATGGSGLLVKPPMLEDEIAERLWTRLGADPDRIIREGRSRNTHENALFSKALLNPSPDDRWLLVTSAFHMSRSVGIFRKLDFNVIPYPVDYYTEGPGIWRVWLSFARSLRLTDRLAHETIGLIAYWLTGKTSELYPAPKDK